MKRIIFSLMFVVLLCSNMHGEVVKDNVLINGAIDIIKNTDSGYFIPLAISHKNDDGLEYLTSYTMTLATFDVFNTGQKIDLDIGYVVENTLIAGVSYELGGLKKFSEVPVLDLINLSVGVFGGYDCEDGDSLVGLNIRVIKLEF